MSPVSPVLGYRFHIRAGEDDAALTAEMLRIIDLFCEENNILGQFHVDPQWRPLARRLVVPPVEPAEPVEPGRPQV